MPARLRFAPLLLALAATSGCASTPDGHRNDTADSSDRHTEWPYWPMSMRIHPLTRLARDPDTGEPWIDVRIELFDRDGQTVRGCGRIRIDLHEATDLEAALAPPVVASWEIDLSDLTYNALRFDPVTRTYLFPLELEPDQLGDSPLLRAYYETGDGRRLKRAEFRFRIE